MKGCVISAAMSGAGKTTVTPGLLAALRNRGMVVQPFKIGPDFIDPGLHELAAGVPSHNLDGWMLSKEANRALFAAAMADKDVAVIEGVMGLFDGFDGSSERGSTAEMAAWLDLPVLFVVDAHAMARSAAALVAGFRSFDSRLNFAGVIFNRVASERHYKMLADAVTNVPILGWLPANPSIEIPERHLGLFTAEEAIVSDRIRAIGEFIERHINIDQIFPSPAGRGRGEGSRSNQILSPSPRPLAKEHAQSRKTKRVALAHDKAFSFYYHANRMQLQAAGAEIVEFSPLVDREVPQADFPYLGGGYPEIYRMELEANVSMRKSIRRFIESGRKFYAECGGLMYLAESIAGSCMVGVIPVKIEMTDRLVNFGYCEIRTNSASILGPAGTSARGHQFHYSRAAGGPGELYTVQQGSQEYLEGFLFPNGIASYIHLHFLSNPALAGNMLQS